MVIRETTNSKYNIMQYNQNNGKVGLIVLYRRYATRKERSLEAGSTRSVVYLVKESILQIELMCMQVQFHNYTTL